MSSDLLIEYMLCRGDVMGSLSSPVMYIIGVCTLFEVIPVMHL